MPFVHPASLNITTCETRLTRFVRQLRRECVRLFSLAVLLFFAAQFPDAAHANGKREVPPPLKMHEKVIASDLIFVGEATRVFFTSVPEGTELQADPENPRYVGTWLRVRVKRMLRNAGGPVDEELTINHPTDGSRGPVLRQTYLGKDLIYFVQVLRSRRNTGETRIAMQFTRGRYVVFPHALDQLDEVVGTIETLQWPRQPTTTK